MTRWVLLHRYNLIYYILQYDYIWSYLTDNDYLSIILSSCVIVVLDHTYMSYATAPLFYYCRQFDTKWRDVYTHPAIANLSWYLVVGNHDYGRDNVDGEEWYQVFIYQFANKGFRALLLSIKYLLLDIRNVVFFSYLKCNTMDR